MFADIYAQPAILRAAVDALTPQLSPLAVWAERLRAGEIRRVVLTGMGGSFAVLFPALVGLVGHGVDARAIETSELLYDYRPLLDANTLVVAVSQSGHSAETVRLLDELGGSVPVIGVTNTPESPLAERSVPLFIGAGAEGSVSTKTYTCTLATLHMFAAALTATPLEAAAAQLYTAIDAVESNLSAWDEAAQALIPRIDPPRFLVFLGRGASRASAMAGALAVKETAKIPTEGMVGGQFRHGPLEVLAPGVSTFVFMGGGGALALNRALVSDLRKRGANVVTIGASEGDAHALPVPNMDDAVRPLADIVPIQLLAARLAESRGIEPGSFIHSSKVTTVE